MKTIALTEFRKKVSDLITNVRSVPFFLMASVLLFVAASPGDLHLTVRFQEIQGLLKGARVVSGQEDMGRVTDILYNDQGEFLVGISIRMEFRPKMTEHARIFITSDPLQTGKKAVGIAIPKPGGRPLEDGAVVSGSPELSGLAAGLLEGFVKGLDALRGKLSEFSRDLRRIPERSEFQNLERELERLSKELERLQEIYRGKIMDEVWPRLRQELDALREWLRRLGEEEDSETIHTKHRPTFTVAAFMP